MFFWGPFKPPETFFAAGLGVDAITDVLEKVRVEVDVSEPKLSLEQLPLKISAYAQCIDSKTRFFIVPEELNETLETQDTVMQLQYTQGEGKNSSFPVEVCNADPCAILHGEGVEALWYRGLVVRVFDRFECGVKYSLAEVLLVDHGEIVITKVSKLKPLLVEFGRYPSFAFPCMCTDLSKTQMSEESVEKMRQCLARREFLIPQVEIYSRDCPLLVRLVDPNSDPPNHPIDSCPGDTLPPSGDHHFTSSLDGFILEKTSRKMEESDKEFEEENEARRELGLVPFTRQEFRHEKEVEAYGGETIEEVIAHQKELWNLEEHRNGQDPSANFKALQHRQKWLMERGKGPGQPAQLRHPVECMFGGNRPLFSKDLSEDYGLYVMQYPLFPAPPAKATHVTMITYVHNARSIYLQYPEQIHMTALIENRLEEMYGENAKETSVSIPEEKLKINLPCVVRDAFVADRFVRAQITGVKRGVQVELRSIDRGWPLDPLPWNQIAHIKYLFFDRLLSREPSCMLVKYWRLCERKPNVIETELLRSLMPSGETLMASIDPSCFTKNKRTRHKQQKPGTIFRYSFASRNNWIKVQSMAEGRAKRTFMSAMDIESRFLCELEQRGYPVQEDDQYRRQPISKVVARVSNKELYEHLVTRDTDFIMVEPPEVQWVLADPVLVGISFVASCNRIFISTQDMMQRRCQLLHNLQEYKEEMLMPYNGFESVQPLRIKVNNYYTAEYEEDEAFNRVRIVDTDSARRNDHLAVPRHALVEFIDFGNQTWMPVEASFWLLRPDHAQMPQLTIGPCFLDGMKRQSFQPLPPARERKEALSVQQFLQPDDAEPTLLSARFRPEFQLNNGEIHYRLQLMDSRGVVLNKKILNLAGVEYDREYLDQFSGQAEMQLPTEVTHTSAVGRFKGVIS